MGTACFLPEEQWASGTGRSVPGSAGLGSDSGLRQRVQGASWLGEWGLEDGRTGLQERGQSVCRAAGRRWGPAQQERSGGAREPARPGVALG